MSVDILILVKLIFAHFLGDFCLQPKYVVDKKKEGKQGYHILHSSVHAALAYLLVGDWSAWYIPLVIFITHYVVDLWKYKNEKSMVHFILDQFLHLSVIILLWLAITQQFTAVWSLIITLLNYLPFWVYLTGFVFILTPTSIILSTATRKWEDGRGVNGLKDAGKWIGYLERTLVFIFMCLAVYEAIGFVLAAKSIYRFGELKDAVDIKKTEYIMIGTFLSFTIAIVVGLIVRCIV